MNCLSIYLDLFPFLSAMFYSVMHLGLVLFYAIVKGNISQFHFWIVYC